MSEQIEKLYYRYGPMVLRRCRQLLVDEGLAEEAMQDVFIRVIDKHKSLDLQEPSSLLYRIATNVCLNMLRKHQSLIHDDHSEQNGILASIVSQNDLEQETLVSQFLKKVFQKEKESTQVLAILHYYDGMTLQEVANEAGMSVSGVRKRLRHAQ